MNRRDFLVSAASAAGFARTRDDCDALAHPALLAVLGGETVRGIGQRYRALVATERDREPLRSAILASGPLRSFWMPRAALAQRVRADFAAGRTVLVAGWVLSVTEARQCALYSLLPSPPTPR
ncbi:MAG TPA: hypothetical protein VGU74_06025 [Gemmatimonadales bacterium]|nr:hypothetical protein [Gemmatimonadales bacterium]